MVVMMINLYFCILAFNNFSIYLKNKDQMLNNVKTCKQYYIVPVHIITLKEI